MKPKLTDKIKLKILDDPISQYKDVCHRIGDVHSREEEQMICTEWIKKLKVTMEAHKMKYAELCSCCKSLIHLHLLGYDTTFGEIHLVTITQNAILKYKALGYLSSMALFNLDHELSLMVVYSAKKDITGTEILPIILGLMCISVLCSTDLISTVIKPVTDLLSHQNPSVRARAIMCIHSFIKKDPSIATNPDIFPQLLQLVKDDDMTVANSALITINNLISQEISREQIVEVTPTMLSLTNTILSNRVPFEYLCSRILAPFVLVHALHYFRLMEPFIIDQRDDIIQLTNTCITSHLDNSSTPGAAILEEAMNLLIEYNHSDSEEFHSGISALMHGSSNTKYVGLLFLQKVPRYAIEFQNEVIDCLQSPDPSLHVETLDILSIMTTQTNINIIVSSLFEYFPTSPRRAQFKIAEAVPQLAALYSPSPAFFTRTIVNILTLISDNLGSKVNVSFSKSVGSAPSEFKADLLEKMIEDLSSGEKFSDTYVRLACFLLGSYSTLVSDKHDSEFCALLLCDICDNYKGSRLAALESLLRLSTLMEEIPEQVAEIFVTYENSSDLAVSEICSFALHLSSSIVKTALEDIDNFDADLSFLDHFVAENKTKDYVPPEERGILPESLSINSSPYKQTVDDTPVEEDNGVMIGSVDNLQTAGLDMVWGPEGINEVQNQDVVMNTTLNVSTNPAYEISAELREELEKVKREMAGEVEVEEKPSLFQQLSKKKKGTAPAEDKKKQALMAAFKETELNNRTEAGASFDEKGQLSVKPKKISRPIKTETEVDTTPIPEYTKVSTTSCFKDPTIQAGVWGQSGTVVITIQNKSDATIPKIEINLQLPKLLKAIETDKYPGKNTIPAKRQEWLQIKLNLNESEDPSPLFTNNLQVAAFLKFNGRQVTFSIPLQLTYFIVPLEMDTKVYGKLWTKGGKEQNCVVQIQTTIDYVSNILTKKLNLFSVQRIKEEEIFAASLCGSTLPQYKIQVHARKTPVKVSFKILTQSEDLSQSIANIIPQLFK